MSVFTISELTEKYLHLLKEVKALKKSESLLRKISLLLLDQCELKDKQVKELREKLKTFELNEGN